MKLATFRRFRANESGTVAIVAAIVFPALLASLGIAVDYAMMSRQKTVLQTIADGAAIAGARELLLASSKDGHVKAAARAYVDHQASRAEGGSDALVLSKVHVGKKEGTVTATLKQHWQPFFAHLFDKSVTPIMATATAQLVTGANICVLGLGDNDSKNVYLEGRASITGNDCGVISNSKDPAAIRADDNGKIVASMICAAGGIRGAVSAFSPGPTTDCPPVDDPLLDRPEPAVGGCDQTATEIKDQVVTLSPGVYCGGLLISGNSQVTFNAGVYIIKGDRFRVVDAAKIIGENVGFYLADDKAQFEFTDDTSIHLTAPKQGPLSGILFFETRSASEGQMHRIRSNDARVLVGTVYLPKGRFMVESKAPVAAESEFTAVVAKSVELLGQPNLVLNADYDQSDIPAPQGLIGGRVVLAR